MRSPQLCPEANIEGRETKADAWERLRNALFACPIRGLFLVELDVLLIVPTCAQKADGVTHTFEPCCESGTIWVGSCMCRTGRLEQDVFELSYDEAGIGGVCSWMCECCWMVRDYNYR